MARTRDYRVLGIDPGLNVTGYGVVDIRGREPRIVEAGAIRTNSRDEMPARIAAIHAEIAQILSEFKPDCVGVEKLYAHYKHPRTSILMAHARGAALLAAEQANVTVRDLPATEVKKALTGNGHATKRQVQLAIQSLCGLDALPDPPDVADALAVALCAARRL